MEKLKPCPFCGGEADCKSWDAGWDSRGDNIFAAMVGCPSCGASFELEHHGDDLLRDDDIEGETCHALEEQAAQLWNSRTGAKEPVAIITIDEEQLQRMVDEAVSTIIDCVELLAVADECDAADVDTDWAERIRKAVGE